MIIQMDKIYKARKYYLMGMLLMVLAGYALLTCGSLLFKLTDNFPTIPLAVAALFLVVYNIIAVFLYIRIVKSQQNSLIHFYLINKVVRMILAFMVIFGSIFISIKGVVSFVISFLVLYLLPILYESVFFVQIERKINKND